MKIYPNRKTSRGYYEKGNVKETFDIERILKDGDGNVINDSTVPVEVNDTQAFQRHPDGYKGYFVYGTDMNDLALWEDGWADTVEIRLNEITNKELGEALVKNSADFVGMDMTNLKRTWAEHLRELGNGKEEVNLADGSALLQAHQKGSGSHVLYC